MAKSQTNYATNASNNLLNQAQGLTGPLLNQFQQSMGGQQQQQGQLYGTIFPQLQQDLTTGGYDPTQLNKLRGEYQPLIETGGFTPQQESQFLARGTEGVTSEYGTLMNQLKRNKAATGGLGTGGEISQMARQMGQGQAQATRDSQIALNQQETANKLQGLAGESGLESGVASGSLAASGQLKGLYDTTTGQITDLGKLMLSTLGLDFSTQEGAIDALTKLSQNPGLFQTGIGDIIGLAGAAAGVGKAFASK